MGLRAGMKSSSQLGSDYDSLPKPSSGGGMNVGQAGDGASGILGFASALMQGDAAEKAGEYNAQIALQNASLSRQQGIEEARRTRVQGRKVLGDARASYGASGIGLTGSALDVLAESAANNELDALTIEHQGESKARMFESDAAMSRYQGDVAKKNSYLKAAGSLIESGAKVAAAGG